jgi:hypothetical protein
MSGYKDYNRPAFDVVAAELMGYGFDVWTPSSLNESNVVPWTWENAVKRCIRELLDRDALIMIPDWQTSQGARLEHFVAESLKIQCFEWLVFRRHLQKVHPKKD